jgi:hypothetical protein
MYGSMVRRLAHVLLRLRYIDGVENLLSLNTDAWGAGAFSFCREYGAMGLATESLVVRT